MGRIQVMVPDVSGFIPTSWAAICSAARRIQNGLLTVPIIGSGVWVEFEQGDPDHLIWVGCFRLRSSARTRADFVPPVVPGLTIRRHCRMA